MTDAAKLETWARTLLRRYGIVFRRLLDREAGAPSWRELLLVYRRLEARGEIRGGRFVAGMAGEQFALPEAVAQLRAVRRAERTAKLVAVSAADPLNLSGVVTPGERVAALTANRVLYQDGVPVMALVAGEKRALSLFDTDRTAELTRSLVRKPATPALRAHLGMAGVPAASAILNRPTRRRRAGVPLSP